MTARTIPVFPLEWSPIGEGHRNGAPQLVRDSDGKLYSGIWNIDHWSFASTPDAALPSMPIDAAKLRRYK